MTTKTEICNLALIKAGHTERVANIETERSLAGELCRLLWKEAVNSTLEEMEPSFARKTQSLAILSDEKAIGWDYVYAMPHDCLTPRAVCFEYQVRDMYNHKENHFEKGLSLDGKRKTICTNIDGAYLIYTTSEVDVPVFDSMFREALTLRLGANLALSLKKSQKVSQSLANSYEILISKHQEKDRNSQHTDENTNYNFTPDQVNARLS